MNSRGIQTLWVVLHFAVLALFILQLIVITGLAIFQMTQRFFVGETNISLSPGHVFRIFSRWYYCFLQCRGQRHCCGPGSEVSSLPTQPLIIFLCFLGFYLWRQLLLRTEPRQASYRHSLEWSFAIKDKASYLVGFLSAIILVLATR